jgi:hypothetical protein
VVATGWQCSTQKALSALRAAEQPPYQSSPMPATRCSLLAQAAVWWVEIGSTSFVAAYLGTVQLRPPKLVPATTQPKHAPSPSNQLEVLIRHNAGERELFLPLRMAAAGLRNGRRTDTGACSRVECACCRLCTSEPGDQSPLFHGFLLIALRGRSF